MSGSILIVEDNEDFRNLIKLTLEMGGYELTMAANGREAIDATEGKSFDLILSDVDMPVMNGLEFVRRFRAERDQTTPIVMLSAEKAQILSSALEAGANGTISKPFEPLQLLDEVKARLE